MFAAIYGDTPPHLVDRVMTSFPCSAISLQRSLCPQYDSSAINNDDYDDDDDGDDISSQWFMSPGPPSPLSVTWLQRSLSLSHDSNSISSVNGGCDGNNDTSSQLSVSPNPPPPKSVATAAQRSSHLVLVTSSHGTMSSDLSSGNSVDLAAHGPSCPALSPYDSNTDDDDVNDCGSVGGGGGDDTSPQWSISSDHASQKSDDIVAQGSIWPAPTP